MATMTQISELDRIMPLPEADFTGPLSTPATALAYILAGKAIFTLRSTVSGQHYTYKVRRAKDSMLGQYWVYLLSGPDNNTSYTYIGMIKDRKVRMTQKSKLPLRSKPVQTLAWALQCLTAPVPRVPRTLEIWHSGRCGRCGRTLTVPSSVAAGIGPECAAKML